MGRRGFKKIGALLRRNKKESAGLKKRGFKGGKKRAGPLE